jgi:hypothetical protein
VYTYTDANCQTLGPPTKNPNLQQSGIHYYTKTWPDAFCVDQMDNGIGLSTSLSNPDGNGQYQKANSVFVNCQSGMGTATLAWWNIYTPMTNPNNPHPPPQTSSFANMCMDSPEAMKNTVHGDDNTCLQVSNAGLVHSVLIDCNRASHLFVSWSSFLILTITSYLSGRHIWA